jgi:hypothetical protein
MPKPFIWLFIGVGLFFMFFGLFFSPSSLLFGFILVGIGLFIGLGPDGILRKDQVLDTWSVLIGNGQGKFDEVLRDTECFVKASKAPSLNIERQDIAPGLIRGLAGTTRDFLVVIDNSNFRLRPYRIFVNARDYGDNLDINWHLTYKPNLLQSIAALLPYVNIIPATLSDLDLFDQQDLRAYATNVHHCLLKAVEKLMLGLNQDISKLERKSKGFLGIS